jgi:hypothetical protein
MLLLLQLVLHQVAKAEQAYAEIKIQLLVKEELGGRLQSG